MHNLRPEELDDFKSETPQAFFRYSDGILVVELKPELIIDLRTIRRMERFRKVMSMGFELPVLIVIPKDHLLLDKEAFQYLGSKEAMDGCVAKAIVIKAPLRVILKNFSLAFLKADKPFRLFVSRSEAKMWLFDHITEEIILPD